MCVYIVFEEREVERYVQLQQVKQPHSTRKISKQAKRMQKGERRPKTKPNHREPDGQVLGMLWYGYGFGSAFGSGSAFAFLILLCFIFSTRDRAYFLVLCRLFFFVVLVLKNEFPTLTPGTLVPSVDVRLDTSKVHQYYMVYWCLPLR